MTRMDDALRDLVQSVSGGVAAGVVDLDSGLLMGIFNNANYPVEMNEMVAAATMDLFRGRHLKDIQKLVRAHRRHPEDGANYFQEIHIVSAHNFHFAKVMLNDQAAVMLVTNQQANIGMCWHQLRRAVPDLEAAF